MEPCKDCNQTPCKGVNCPSVNNIEAGGEIGFISSSYMHSSQLYDHSSVNGISTAKYRK